MPGVEHVPIKWAQPPWIVERAGRMQPIAVVDHIMQGFLNTIVNWASNGESKIIVHFGIDRNGRIVQFQPVHTPGRHVSAINSPASKLVRARGQDAGTTGANGYTIGIEHEGCSVPLGRNDPASIRNVTWSKSNPWPEPMIAASIRVKQWCFANVPSLGQPSRDTIIGHFEIDARNRPDDPAPGSNRDIWPSARMVGFATQRIDDTQDTSGGQVTPVVREKKMSNAYIVQRGDTLRSIAERFETSVPALQQRNGISDPNRIEVGQVLRLTDDAPMPKASGVIPRETPPQIDESVVNAAFGDGYGRALRDAAALVERRGSQPVIASHQQVAEELRRKANEPPPPR